MSVINALDGREEEGCTGDTDNGAGKAKWQLVFSHTNANTNTHKNKNTNTHKNKNANTHKNTNTNTL